MRSCCSLELSLKLQTHAADNLHTFADRHMHTHSEHLALQHVLPTRQRQVLAQSHASTHTPNAPALACMHPIVIVLCCACTARLWRWSGCCKADKLGGLAQEVWRSSGARETISSLRQSGGGEGEDALSREEFLECCPLI